MNPGTVKERSDSQNTPERKPAGRATLQAIDGTGRGLGNISRLQISRVVSALQAGKCEKGIALNEGLPESCIRWIRRVEMERISRALSCVSIGIKGVHAMIAEQEKDLWDELLEREGA